MLVQHCLVLTITFGMIVGYWIEPPIPDYLHICEKRDLNLTNCLKTSITSMRSVLKNGIPNVEMASLDPLEIGDLFKANIKRYGLHVKVENLVIMGILKYNVDHIEVLKHGKLYKIDVSFPKLQIEGACEVSGDLKYDMIDENCSFVETFSNSSGVVMARFSHVPDGWLVQTKGYDIRIKMGKSMVKIFDISEGRRILDKYEINSIINKSFDDINREMVPVVEKVLQHQLKEMSNKVFSNFSYGQIFPLSF